jgi:putative phosphoesterase
VRFAIISDIHGNLVALKLVLSDLRRRRIKKIFCLGDVAADGPQPNEAIELLQSLALPCVMGNTDEALARNVPPPVEEWEQLPEEEKRRFLQLDQWTRARLNKSNVNYLSTLTPTVMFSPENGLSLLCYHGSPKSNREEIEATTPDEELNNSFRGYDADIFAGGHTHRQMFRRFQRSVIVNPGSVGLPFRVDASGRLRHPTQAEYAIVNVVERSFGLELLSIPYIKTDLVAAVRGSGLPNQNWWLSDWY